MFLYGMQVMGDGLAKVSGGKLEQILENLTSSKWKAVLLGMCVTAVIQSSSATTVMVVGFVNSGIMKLTQAVGIIMGANIGTTITSWILSLTGIESSNFFISLLKPSSFFTNSRDDWNYFADFYKEFPQKRHRYDHAWFCSTDVWYGKYERSCETSG